MLQPEEMTHLARLARLAPDGAQLARYGAQCADVLNYMSVLAEVNTDGTDPLYSPVQHPGPLRPDKVERRRRRAEVLACAPESDGTYFVVPRIV